MNACGSNTHRLGAFDCSCGSAQGNYRNTVCHPVYGSSIVKEHPYLLCPCKRKWAEATDRSQGNLQVCYRRKESMLRELKQFCFHRSYKKMQFHRDNKKLFFFLFTYLFIKNLTKTKHTKTHHWSTWSRQINKIPEDVTANIVLYTNISAWEHTSISP